MKTQFPAQSWWAGREGEERREEEAADADGDLVARARHPRRPFQLVPKSEKKLMPQTETADGGRDRCFASSCESP